MTLNPKARPYDIAMRNMLEKIDLTFRDTERLVIYSAYGTNYDGPVDLYIDNLSDIAIVGKCILTMRHTPIYGPGSPYVSSELENPTWLDLTVIANEMMLVTGDLHHCFFEGVTHIHDMRYEFVMGS